MARKKGKTPSRLKYEKTHPVVSARVPPDLYARVMEAKKAGSSIIDILKIGLGLVEVKNTKEGEAWQRGWNRGIAEGFAIARKRYMVTYKCSVCRGEMEVEHNEEKKAIAEYMRQAGWSHGECASR